jgi:hypothetical protein
VTAAEAIAVADIEEAKSLATELEALGGGALAMALAQEAEAGDLMHPYFSMDPPRHREALVFCLGRLALLKSNGVSNLW